MLEKICLQWNDFKENVNIAFGRFRSHKDFTDVTLACEDGQQIEAHKIILAASSPFFEKILESSKKHPHPWIYLRGVQSSVLVPILDFLYFGEVNIDEDTLDSFLAIAEELKLKGLTAEELKLIGLEDKFPQVETEEDQDMSTIAQDDNKTQESMKISGIRERLVKKDVVDSTVYSKRDLKALDEKVKSLMEKGSNMVQNGPKMKTTAFICKVCGKEGRPAQIRDHVEANHLDGIALLCDKILTSSGEACGRTFSGRRNLIKHTTKFH